MDSGASNGGGVPRKPGGVGFLDAPAAYGRVCSARMPPCAIGTPAESRGTACGEGRVAGPPTAATSWPVAPPVAGYQPSMFAGPGGLAGCGLIGRPAQEGAASCLSLPSVGTAPSPGMETAQAPRSLAQAGEGAKQFLGRVRGDPHPATRDTLQPPSWFPHRGPGKRTQAGAALTFCVACREMVPCRISTHCTGIYYAQQAAVRFPIHTSPAHSPPDCKAAASPLNGCRFTADGAAVLTGVQAGAFGQAPQPRVALDGSSEEEPVYVNAKQYHCILRRRQQRAKAEPEEPAAQISQGETPRGRR